MQYRDPNPGNDPTRGDVEEVQILSARADKPPREKVVLVAPAEPEEPRTVDDYRRMFRDPDSRHKSAQVSGYAPDSDRHGTVAEEYAAGRIVGTDSIEDQRAAFNERRMLKPGQKPVTSGGIGRRPESAR